MPTGIGAYDEAGPLSGNVPPMTIALFVTPGAALAPASAVTHATAATTNAAASTPNLLFMLSPLCQQPDRGASCRSKCRAAATTSERRHGPFPQRRSARRTG